MNRQIVRAYFLVLIAILSTIHTGSAQKEITVYPTELYSSTNEITITAPDGIRSITYTASRNLTLTGDGPGSCETERKLKVFVNTASQEVTLNLVITDCKGRIVRRILNQNTIWTLDQIRFSVAEQGEKVCQEFSVRSTGEGEIILDDVVVNDPRVTVQLPGRVPVRIPALTNYSYRVCFSADEPGIYTFPVITYIRRNQPSGGETSYPVSDTGLVRVVEKTREDVTDPTTFRSVAVPNAVIPKKGTLYVGSYDLLGLTAGYSFDDHMMVIAGGALPLPDDWGGIRGEMFGAYSIGVKVGLPIGDDLDIAAGYQFATSIYDKEETPDALESEITIHAPYAAASYGNDDSRLSLTLGYAFKHHTTLSQEFDRNALIVALGGDYRIGERWKLAGEIVSMQTLDVVPIIATVRYFTNRFAIDLGVGYVGITTGDAKPPAIPVVPVLSGIFVF